MHAALAAGHDRAVLQAALRRLQPPQVSSLIAYLLKWVACHPGEIATATESFCSFECGKLSCRRKSLIACSCKHTSPSIKVWPRVVLSGHLIGRRQVKGASTGPDGLALCAADQESCRAGSLAPGLALPPMEAVLMWACATLDAHFITLAGLPAGAQQALLAVRARIQETLQVYLRHHACSGSCLCFQMPFWAYQSSRRQKRQSGKVKRSDCGLYRADLSTLWLS